MNDDVKLVSVTQGQMQQLAAAHDIPLETSESEARIVAPGELAAIVPQVVQAPIDAKNAEWIKDIQERLIEQSAEIAAEGHDGWGNTMAEAACLLKMLNKPVADPIVATAPKLTECRHCGFMVSLNQPPADSPVAAIVPSEPMDKFLRRGAGFVHALYNNPRDTISMSDTGQWIQTASDLLRYAAPSPTEQATSPIFELWDAAKAEAAMYVEHHCVDGEMHAAAILKQPRPSIKDAEQASDVRNLDMEKLCTAIMLEVEGNIRPTVRDCVNGADDVQDIYEYCDTIEGLIESALKSSPAAKGNAPDEVKS